MTLLVSFAIGCASPGNPHPPSLNLSAVVTDLTARRIGDQVQLHWTTPSRTTDGLDTKGPLTAGICRQATPASPCAPILRLPVKPGPSQTVDALPPSLTAEPATLLAYRVQIFNPSERSAGPSPQAFAATGIAPPSIAQLRATATRDGAMIEWLPSSQTSSQVELDRTLTGPSAAPKKPAKSSPGKAPTLNFTPSQPTEVHLQTADAGGTLDRTAHNGETYTYTAQRVRSVQIDGHALELRSHPSSPATLLLIDTFPPKSPTGLVTVPEDAGPNPSIDLSWEPDTENDLAGYIVYRQELAQPQDSAVRLTPTPVVGPAFRDLTATLGHRYAYRVTAIDTAGNESAPSAAVQETLKEP
jgi:hypothetical protein